MISIVGAVFVAPVAIVGAVVGVGAATLMVAGYTMILTAALLLGWKPLQALPELQVGLWHNGELVTEYPRRADRVYAPVDIDLCVRNALADVRKEVPAPPPDPKDFPGLGLAVNTAAVTAMSRMADQFGGETREEAVARLDTELAAYEGELRRWLEAYENRRWTSYSTVEAPVAIQNGGEDSAERIVLRLVYPSGLTPGTSDVQEAFELPPERPRYEQRGRYGAPMLDLTTTMPRYPELNLPGARARSAVEGPTYVRDHDRDVAEVRLAGLTHGVTERTGHPLEVLPREPGDYELEWEAHVGNLRQPERGTIRLTIEAVPASGDPLTTVEAVVEAREVEFEEGWR